MNIKLKTLGLILCGASLSLGLQAAATDKGDTGNDKAVRGQHRFPPAVVEKYDKDGDGKLSQEERKALKADMLAKYDKDGDGKLSEEERQAMREDIRATVGAKRGDHPVPPAILEKYDKDGDGKLSEEERQALHADMLAKYDKDGDGKLSEEERQAMRQDIGAKRHKKGGPTN